MALEGPGLRAAAFAWSCRGLCPHRQWQPELEGWAERLLCVTWRGEFHREDKPWFGGAVATLRYPGCRMAQEGSGGRRESPNNCEQGSPEDRDPGTQLLTVSTGCGLLYASSRLPCQVGQHTRSNGCPAAVGLRNKAGARIRCLEPADQEGFHPDPCQNRLPPVCIAGCLTCHPGVPRPTRGGKLLVHRWHYHLWPVSHLLKTSKLRLVQ